MIKPYPSAGELNVRFIYNEITGELFYKTAGHPNRQSNRAVGTVHNGGYLIVRIKNSNYRLHRIIWKMLYDEEPEEIDHINGIKGDNRLVNLRACTRRENMRNLSKSVKNTSGVLGVRFWPERNRWHVRINHGKYVGIFKTFEEAIRARNIAESVEGYHENHGKQAYTASEDSKLPANIEDLF